MRAVVWSRHRTLYQSRVKLRNKAGSAPPPLPLHASLSSLLTRTVGTYRISSCSYSRKYTMRLAQSPVRRWHKLGRQHFRQWVPALGAHRQMHRHCEVIGVEHTVLHRVHEVPDGLQRVIR